MKIIFLDIDGVLNNQLYLKTTAKQIEGESKEDWRKRRWFEPRAIGLLNYLISETDAKVVISSSWRTQWKTDEDAQEFFDSIGFEGDIIGRTPRLFFTGLEGYSYSVPRGNEIKAWLETNKDILSVKMSKVKYVILDDDSDMLYWQRNNFVWVDPYCGLTPATIYKAKQILNR